MGFKFDHGPGRRFLSAVQHYNYKKYWIRREKVIDKNYKNKFLKLYYLYYIKKTDAYHNCSFGTNYNSGTIFKSPPILPHGPKNIIVGHDLIIGKNVTIFHTVTLAHGGSIIGDNVMFSTGSVLLPGKNVGEHSLIGANAVVIEDIPPHSTVVLQKPRVIKNNTPD